jgi:hypothetical protein
MRIDPKNEPSALASAALATRTKAQKPVTAQDQPAFEGTERLTRALAEIPLVRADKVAMAKNLIKDPSYPSNAVLEKVSNLLANNIKPE